MFTELVEKLHVKNVQIDDVYSIDRDSLRAAGPLYGVIFLFKYGDVDRRHAAEGNRVLEGQYDEAYQEKDIFFANQMIQNACATQALLNVLFNNDSIDLGKELGEFKSFVKDFDSELIGETISNSDLIRKVHNSFSPPVMIEVTQNERRSSGDDGLFHFIGYTRVGGYIYEFDGLKNFPIRHCECISEEEFYEKLPNVLSARISKYGEELRFSLLAITEDKLQRYQDLGDDLMVSSELSKRESWKRENAYRRQDYTGLIVHLLKDYSRKLSDKEWEAALNAARKKTQIKVLSDNAT